MTKKKFKKFHPTFIIGSATQHVPNSRFLIDDCLKKKEDQIEDFITL